jgi:hypothetical protein
MPILIKEWPLSETVTVGDLILELQKHDPEMAVAFLWESQITPVVLDRIKVMPETDKVYGPVLLMDAET